jgi:hypothetical protein
MMLPMGCQESCLTHAKVAYFGCAETGKEIRQLYEDLPVNTGVWRLPAFATLPSKATPMLPTGCLTHCRLEVK